MHVVDDSIETVHLYVVREEPKRPYTVLPLFVACLCLLLIAGLSVYSGEHPYYEHQTLTVPAQLLPPQTFTGKRRVAISPLAPWPFGRLSRYLPRLSLHLSLLRSFPSHVRSANK